MKQKVLILAAAVISITAAAPAFAASAGNQGLLDKRSIDYRGPKARPAGFSLDMSSMTYYNGAGGTNSDDASPYASSMCDPNGAC